MSKNAGDRFGISILDEIAPTIVVFSGSLNLKNLESVEGRIMKIGNPKEVLFKETELRPASTAEFVPFYMDIVKFVGRDDEMKEVNRPNLCGFQVVELRKDKLGPIIDFNNKMRDTSGDQNILCKRQVEIKRKDFPNKSGQGSYTTYQIKDLGADDSWDSVDPDAIEHNETEPQPQLNTTNQKNEPSKDSAHTLDTEKLVAEFKNIKSVETLANHAGQVLKAFPDSREDIVKFFQERKAAIIVGEIKASAEPMVTADILGKKYYAKEPKRAQDLKDFAAAIAMKEEDLTPDDVPF